MITIGTTAKAAASGVFPAVPCNWYTAMPDETAPNCADDLRDDVVPHRQREGEDRPCDHPWQRQWQDHRAERLGPRGPKVG